MFIEFNPLTESKKGIVTARHLGERTIEVTAKAGDITVIRLYKETLSPKKSAERVRKISENLFLEHGISVKDKEIYHELKKATKGLPGIHVFSYYRY